VNKYESLNVKRRRNPMLMKCNNCGTFNDSNKGRRICRLCYKVLECKEVYKLISESKENHRKILNDWDREKCND